MKYRIFTILALASIFCLKISAQETISISTDERIEIKPVGNKNILWGIKGSLNAELPGRWRNKGNSHKTFNSGFGASIGGLANIYIDKNFYFEPELSIFYEGYSYNNIQPVAPNSPSVNVGPTIYKMGVRVPLMFGYAFSFSDNWGLNVFTGPQFDIAFAGWARTSDPETKENKDLMSVFSHEYAQRRADLEWKIGVGFPVDHFMISLEAEIGITNLMKHTYTFRENRLGLGISYYF